MSVKIVLTINQDEDNLPLVDAAFLASMMHGMSKHDDSGMTWCITVDGFVYDSLEGPA